MGKHKQNAVPTTSSYQDEAIVNHKVRSTSVVWTYFCNLQFVKKQQQRQAQHHKRVSLKQNIETSTTNTQSTDNHLASQCNNPAAKVLSSTVPNAKTSQIHLSCLEMRWLCLFNTNTDHG